MVVYMLDGDLDLERIRAQITDFKRVGYGGFLIWPFTGLTEPFMSEPWLDAAELMCETAREVDLDVWIWDEWGFPSGIGGGLVTAEERFRARTLHLAADLFLQPGETAQMTCGPRVLAAAAVRVDKYGEPAGEWRPIPATPGAVLSHRSGTTRERLIVVGWEFFSAHQPTWDRSDRHSVDMLNPNATRRFIEVLHEPYARRLSRFFGKVLKGFFYDEPTLAFPYPWTDALPERFRRDVGYDLTPRLPELLAVTGSVNTDPGQAALRESRPLVDDYLAVWTDMAAESFYGELESWCHAHRLKSIGHQDMDHRLFNLATVSGDIFKNSAHNDRPGVDLIDGQILPGIYADFPRYGGSAARVLGKERAMSESFAVQGHGMSADDMRFFCDHQIIRNVTHFFAMVATHSTGRPGHWGPNLNSELNPMIDRFGGVLNERTARAAAVMTAGTSCVQTALYLPIADMAADQLVLRHPHTRNNPAFLWDIVTRIARRLTYLPVEFDYLWDDAIRASRTEAGRLITPSGVAYTTVILPGNVRLHPGAAARLGEFSRSGGRLVSMDAAPKRLETAVELFGGHKAFDELVARPVRLSGRGRCISLAGRRIGELSYWLLLNEDDEAVEVDVRLEASYLVGEMDLTSGRIRSPGDAESPRFRFEPMEMRCLVTGSAEAARHAAAAVDPPWRSGTAFEIESFLVNGPGGTRRRIGYPLPEWSTFLSSTYTGSVTYEAELDWPADAGTDTGLLDLGDVRHAAEVRLDDGEVTHSVAFRPFRCLLTGLNPGPHRLRIEVWNTPANAHREERYGGRELDLPKLRSGLFGPVRIVPMYEQGNG
jgi:hypothetical protein